MRLTPIERAIGASLARDVAAPTGSIPLVRAGITVGAHTARTLFERGVRAVWIHDELSAGIEPVELLPEPVRAEAAGRVEQALASANTALAAGRPVARAALDELSSVVETLIRSIVATPDAALALHDLAVADAYTHRHSVNVCALGLLLGRTAYRRDGWTDFHRRRRFDGIDERLTKLGMGLLLHDIGKVVVPPEVLNKPGPLTDREWELMRTHPDVGVELLRSETFGPLIRSVVRDHHERWDGSGYPRGLIGERITHFARVAAVADVYDAVAADRPYKRAMPAHEAVRIVVDGSGTMFDSEVVEVFRRVVLPYPLGSEVELDDGTVGVVCHVDPNRPHEPIVRFRRGGDVRERRVDLS